LQSLAFLLFAGILPLLAFLLLLVSCHCWHSYCCQAFLLFFALLLFLAFLLFFALLLFLAFLLFFALLLFLAFLFFFALLLFLAVLLLIASLQVTPAKHFVRHWR
jgi:hypothetical protein